VAALRSQGSRRHAPGIPDALVIRLSRPRVP